MQMQLHGHVIAEGVEYDDERKPVPGSGRIGIVTSTGTAVLHQPDRVAQDASTGVEVDRQSRPDLTVQTVDVAWEDGSESTLTEHLDSWIVLGSLVAFPKIDDPANPTPGAFGELPEQQAVIRRHVADVTAYALELRAAAPLAEAARAARVERVTVYVDAGDITLAE